MPREINAQLGDDVDVELIDKKGEDWKQQPKKFKAFADGGQSLSSAAPSAASARLVKGKAAVVDAAKPSTSIQVRLHDGGRLVVKLNHEHTVGDLRAHIEAYATTPSCFIMLLSAYLER